VLQGPLKQRQRFAAAAQEGKNLSDQYNHDPNHHHMIDIILVITLRTVKNVDD
jgi:hypothetical protein